MANHIIRSHLIMASFLGKLKLNIFQVLVELFLFCGGSCGIGYSI